MKDKKDELKRLFDGNELRRIQKAARDKDLRKLTDWAKQFEDQIRLEYEEDYKLHLLDAIDNFIIAIVYTLHFNEKTNFGQTRVYDFMQDLLSTIDNFNDGSYSPAEYKKILEDEGITISFSKKQKKE